MEGLGYGPYARVIRLSNGHYKRIVDPVVPKIFLKCQNCCNDRSDSINFDFLSEETYATSSATSLKSIEEHQVENERINSLEYQQEYTPLVTLGQGTIISKALSNSRKSQESHQEQKEEPEESKEERALDKKNSLAEQKEEDKEEGIENKTSQENFEQILNKYEHDEGMPVLFYTKKRDSPALVTMIIDHDMNVIYMRKNKVSRFFPIKLIENLVTHPRVITEEFRKHIKKDPSIRVGNMVVFNASNFTDPVAIQFADLKSRDNFIFEVNKIKDLIKNRFQG